MSGLLLGRNGVGREREREVDGWMDGWTEDIPVILVEDPENQVKNFAN